MQNETTFFLCVGTQKAGTTSLYNILKQHPNICLPKDKETKFFLNDKYFNKGLSFYKNEFFESCVDELLIGDIDPEYMYFENIPERIYNTLGKDIKIIFILRNPANRAYSHYLMNKRRGYEKEKFENSILLESSRLEKNSFYKNHYSYIDRGFYSKQINNYLKYFQKKNMFFIVFEEDFIKNKQNTIKELLVFLNIDDKTNSLNLNIKSNQASVAKNKLIKILLYNQSSIYKSVAKIIFPTRKLRKKVFDFFEKRNLQVIDKQSQIKKLDEETKKHIIQEYFLHDIRDLEDIIHRDLSIWYK